MDTTDKSLLITGVNGLLGANLVDAAADRWSVIASSQSPPLANKPVKKIRLDITDAAAISRAFDRFRPGAVIHCAAETGVDYCQQHPDLAEAVNAVGTRNIARAAAACSARMVYISSDSVFDGRNGGYREEDATGPVNVYAESKLRGEEFVQESCSDFLIARTNMYGWNMGDQRSLAEWIVGSLCDGDGILGFQDVVFNPLLVNDLVDIILEMLGRGVRGVYHIGARDRVTKCDFAFRVARLFGLDTELIKPADSAEARLGAPRPKVTFLDCSRVECELGRPMPSVDEGLSRFRELDRSGYREYLKKPLRPPT